MSCDYYRLDQATLTEKIAAVFARWMEKHLPRFVPLATAG